MSTLNRQMAKGAAWLILFKLTERSIGVVSTLILARVLVPADFGLIAMATSLLAALELLGAFSFDLALIQNQDAERRHYDTAWTFDVAFGVFKAMALCALAIPAAIFFNEPRVERLLYALALCTLIQGFDNVGIVAFQKDLELHKEFWFGLARKLTGFTVTVTLAFALRSYWALMAGILATRITSVLLSYRLHPYRPRLSFEGAGDLFNFSKWLLLNNLLIFVNNRGTDFVIGKLVGARALGLYAVSYEIANLPTTELVFPISRAVFPGYAKLANDVPRLRETFTHVIGLVALLTVPVGTAIALVAPTLVQVLLGSQWSDAAPLIQVLAIFGIVRSMHGPTGSIYLALGKPRVIAALQCAQLGIAIVLMLALVPSHGVIGAAWSIVAGASAAMLLNYAMAVRELRLPLSNLVGALWRPLAGAGAMAAAVKFTFPLLSSDPGVIAAALRLVALCSVAAAGYLSIVVGAWMVAMRPEGAESQIFSIVAGRYARQASSPAPGR